LATSGAYGGDGCTTQPDFGPFDVGLPAVPPALGVFAGIRRRGLRSAWLAVGCGRGAPAMGKSALSPDC
jgi:hypothetical protein